MSSVTSPFFLLQQARSRPVRLEACAVDDAIRQSGLLRQRGEDAGEDPVAGPADVTVAERLVPAMDRRGIAPAQAVALNVDDAAQDAPVIHPRPAPRARKPGRKPLDLLTGQPKLPTHGETPSAKTRIRPNQARSSPYRS